MRSIWNVGLLVPLAIACGAPRTSTTGTNVVENVTTARPSNVTIGAELRGALGLERAGAPSALDPKATTRFAVLTTRYDDKRGFDKTMAVYRVGNGMLEIESNVKLPLGDALVDSWGWRDANELVLLLSDGRLLAVRDGKVAPIERPAKRHFTTQKPGGTERFDRDEGLIFTAHDDVWLHHCGWGYRGDEDPCVAEVYVRVAPAPVEVDTHPPTRRADRAALAKPDGWTYSITPGPDGEYGALHCKGPSAAATHPPLEDSFGFTIDDARWLSHRPPIATVLAWYAGLDDASGTERFLVGCALDASLQPRSIVTGPNGFWAIDDSQGGAGGTDKAVMIVFWHGLPIASLEGAASLAFAP